MQLADLLWVWLRPVTVPLVHMMMVRMPVGLLSLLAGRPLLSRRRAAVLRNGRDHCGQHGTGETHTKKCANHASLGCHIHSLYHDRPNAVPGVRRRDKWTSLRRDVREMSLKTDKGI